MACGAAYYNWQSRKRPYHEETVLQLVLEQLTLRLFVVHSDQLSYETVELAKPLLYNCVVMLTELRLRQLPCGVRIPIPCEAPILFSQIPATLRSVVVSSLSMPVYHAA